jgi:peptidoglycan hydrolase-like protein with peptidoglycan-binding domain
MHSFLIYCKKEMVKLGDTGLEVTEVQKLLSMLGYDLIVDGNSLSGTVGVGTFGTFDVSGAKIDGQ